MKWTLLIGAVGALALAASAAELLPAGGPKTSIYWSDGDSGRLNGVKFRLANVDAPETGGVGAYGGAKCEAERELGYEVKAEIVEFTRNADIEISQSYGADRYGREVVKLRVNGSDLVAHGLKTGLYRPWPHKGTRAPAPKPEWCALIRAAAR